MSPEGPRKIVGAGRRGGPWEPLHGAGSIGRGERRRECCVGNKDTSRFGEGPGQWKGSLRGGE